MKKARFIKEICPTENTNIIDYSLPVFMFNIGVYGLDPNITITGRDYINPNQGENLKDGSLRVRRITGETAYKIYGKS